MMHEKIAAVIGPSYFLAFTVGGLIGLSKVPPERSRRTYRLMINNYLNNIGKTSARFGNNVGAGIFLFLVVGKSLNFVFYEELEGTSETAKNALYGAVTGSLYKSTRGLRAMGLASVLGAAAGSFYSYQWEKRMLA